MICIAEGLFVLFELGFMETESARKKLLMSNASFPKSIALAIMWTLKAYLFIVWSIYFSSAFESSTFVPFEGKFQANLDPGPT